MKDVREFVRDLDITTGSHRRLDCPSCGGRNTFSVSNDGGTVKFFCFKASCPTRGQVEGRFRIPSVTEIKRDTTEYPKVHMEWPVPSYFKSETGKIDKFRTYPTFYDVKENRRVFLVRDFSGKVIDAIGRRLNTGYGDSPKWKRYAASGHPFICGDYTGCGIIVEDCISAVAVNHSGAGTGVAILGTHLHVGITRVLKYFNSLVVALDKDATNKAVEMSKKLSWILPTRCVMLEEDLKYYSNEDVREILK